MFSKKMNERSSKLALICFVEVRNVVNFSGCVFERESEQGTEVVLMCVEEVTCADLCLDVCGRGERCADLCLDVCGRGNRCADLCLDVCGRGERCADLCLDVCGRGDMC